MTVQLARLPYLATRAYQKLSGRYLSLADVHARERHVVQQLADIARLRLGRNRVGLSDYIDQGMFSRTIFPEFDTASLGGMWYKEYVHSQLNDIRWEGMVTDKLVMYGLFHAHGFPYPKIRAVAWRRKRHFGDVPVYDRPEPLAEFLRNGGDAYPLFCKPVKGNYGRNAYRLEGYDAADDTLLLGDGTRAPLLPFLRSLEDDGWGTLFQDAVMAAESTRPICGDAVSGCRIIMLLDDEEVIPYRAVWKVPALSNSCDNFHQGSTGNTIAAVDMQSGKVTRALTGKGSQLGLTERHPQTGHPLLGIRVPQWDEIMALMEQAAASFPGFRFQHWDVGITSEGPVLYELNSAGNTDIAQMAYGKGVHDAQIRDFLRRHGNRRPAPGKVF